MDKLFGVLIFSFFVTLASAVPFINLLYKLKFQRQKEHKEAITGESTKVVTRLHAWKVGTPNAGGLLIIAVTIVLSAIFYKLTKFNINLTAEVLYLTLVSFGVIGFYDDIHKFFGWNKMGVWGLKARYKILLQFVLGLLIGALLYYQMGLSSVFVPFLGMFDLGFCYI